MCLLLFSHKWETNGSVSQWVDGITVCHPRIERRFKCCNCHATAETDKDQFTNRATIYKMFIIIKLLYLLLRDRDIEYPQIPNLHLPVQTSPWMRAAK